MKIDQYPWLDQYVEDFNSFGIPSSLIIEGSLGLAKSTLAKFLAKKLLCQDFNGPCESCNSCNFFQSGSHPDYCFLDKNSSSSSLHSFSKAKKDDLIARKIEGIRALNEFISRTNSVSQKRVCIIFDAHEMNLNSQNALLKTLEELPLNKHIIIVTNKRKYFLPTIYSRSSIVSIKNPNTKDLDDWLHGRGYLNFTTLNFAPDSSPLEIESLIKNDQTTQYEDIISNLNLFCLNSLPTPDLIKVFKDMNLSYEDKINALIIFLKLYLGVSCNFFKDHPLLSAVNNRNADTSELSNLIEELVIYKSDLLKVTSLNETIGLNYFFLKLKQINS
jgi:hypothetical protein